MGASEAIPAAIAHLTYSVSWTSTESGEVQFELCAPTCATLFTLERGATLMFRAGLPMLLLHG